MLRPDVIPPEIVDVCRRLRGAGHQAYLVGGAVRDHLRLPDGAAVAKDFDIATSAHPEQVIALFGKKSTVPTGLQHGTVTVLVPRPGARPGATREHVEVTTFRGEGAYSDGRRPDEVAFIDDLVEDLRRRDFTINAIAYDPVDDRLSDPFCGAEDLGRRLIRAVGDPAARFGEDGLRTMRAVRFAAQLEFAIDPATAAAIPGALQTLRRVSAERVRDELLKLLGAARPSLGLRPMIDAGILGAILPALPAAPGPEELAALDALPRDPLLRLGALLYPLGAQGGAPDPAGRTLAVEGLRLSSKERDRLLALLAAPDPGYEPGWSEARLRRYLAQTPEALRQDLFAVQRALAAARGQLEPFDAEPGPGALHRRAAAEAARRPPLSTGELALSGKDVLQLLGLPPGPRVGELLRGLLEDVLDDPARNTRPELERLLRARYGPT